LINAVGLRLAQPDLRNTSALLSNVNWAERSEARHSQGKQHYVDLRLNPGLTDTDGCAITTAEGVSPLELLGANTDDLCRNAKILAQDELTLAKVFRICYYMLTFFGILMYTRLHRIYLKAVKRLLFN
jgi:hypothetical protein